MSPYMIGRFLIVLGLLIVAAGLVFLVGGRLGLGRLLGDLTFHRGSATVFFPIATCIVVSLALTLLLNLILRWRR